MNARGTAAPSTLIAFAPLPWLAYALFVARAGALRPEHVIIVIFVGALVAWSDRTRRFFLDALPFLVLFILYDSLRFWAGAAITGRPVLTCGIRSMELALFGFDDGGQRVTPNDYFVAHHSPALDVICAIPYGSYLPIMVVQFVYLYWRDRPSSKTFAYVALLTHVFGFATYRLLPGAPPWYVREHGCAIDFAVHNSPAALARVDALFGIDYFHDLYRRGSVVFGALPSLHICYPLYGLLVTFRRASWPSRIVQIAYALVMPFAAIYLDHHWVLDVVLGLTYVLVAYALVRAARLMALTPSPLRSPRAPDPTAPPAPRAAALPSGSTRIARHSVD